MALKLGDVRHIPTGAIRLERNEAILYQDNRIEKWKNLSDTWFLRNGTFILAASAAISAISYTNFFWWKLRIGKGAFRFTYVPTVVIPASTAYFTIEKYIKEPITIQEFGCPVCAEIRASLLMSGVGVVQAYCLAFLGSIAAASSTYSYPLPDLNPAKPVKYFRFVKKICYQSKSRVWPLLFLNVALSCFVTYKFNEEILYLNSQEEFRDFDSEESVETFTEFE